MTRAAIIRGLLPCLLIITNFTACSRDPNVRKQKYFDSGEKYFAQGKYPEAIIQYSNAIQIDSHFAQAHYQLGQAYLKLGDGNRALQELNNTVDSAPDNYRARTDIANLLVTVRNPDGSPSPDALKQAKVQLDVLREKAPNTPETHEAWADYDSAENDLVSAVNEMDQAIKLDPSRSESYLMMAILQLRSKRPDQAEGYFKQAVQADPKGVNALVALGSFYETHNRVTEAEQEFRQAIAAGPKDPAPRTALVQALMQQGKRDEAEAFLRQTKSDLPDNSVGYCMLGDFYFSLNEIDKATTEYASIYKEHPKDLKVKRNYVQLLILKNRLDDATKLNDELLVANPRDVDALIYRAQIQMRQNNPGAAVESLQKALQDAPDSAIARYQLGLAFSQQHDITRAESEWREAVRIKPDLIDAQRTLATLEIGRGDTDAVLQTADQVIAVRPDLPDGFLLRSIANLGKQKYADAEQDAQTASQRAPQSPAPYVRLGQIQLAQKRYSEAEKFYQQALDKDPASSDGLSGLMNTYFAEKQMPKAVAAVNAQIQKVPNNSNFYDLLGTALFDGNKDLHGAETALRKAIELDKNNADAIEKLGKVQIQEGATDQAIALYQQAIKDNPGEARFYLLAGELYESKQDWDNAKSMYEQALKISPDNARVCNNLAYVMLEQGGNVDVALSMAQTARRGMPESPSAADTLGWAYFHKGIYQTAISQFQEALRLNAKHGNADDGVFYYHLGLAYQKLNQNALARQQLERAMKLNNADARKALSTLGS
jgi:cellulose synthase operon protein C